MFTADAAFRRIRNVGIEPHIIGMLWNDASADRDIIRYHGDTMHFRPADTITISAFAGFIEPPLQARDVHVQKHTRLSNTIF